MSFWYLQFSQKTNEKIRLNYYGTSSRIVFVCFLGELKIPKRHFEINWPLALLCHVLLCPQKTLLDYNFFHFILKIRYEISIKIFVVLADTIKHTVKQLVKIAILLLDFFRRRYRTELMIHIPTYYTWVPNVKYKNRSVCIIRI